jgi:hypothetical protein
LGGFVVTKWRIRKAQLGGFVFNKLKDCEGLVKLNWSLDQLIGLVLQS